MLIEEDVKEISADVNPDALEAVLEEEIIIEEDELPVDTDEDEDDADEIDIAFAANDEGYW